MMSTSAIALSGMNAAQTRLQASGHNIANLASSGFRRERVVQSAESSDGTSARVEQVAEEGPAMETDMVGLLEAKNSFLANLAVFKTGDRMTGSLLDAVG